MTGWFLVSYLALWALVLLLCLVLIGSLRELALLRRGSVPVLPNPAESGPALGDHLLPLTLDSAEGIEQAQLGASGGAPTLLVFLTPMCNGCQGAAEVLERSLATGDTANAEIRIVLCGPIETCRSFLSVYTLPTFVTIDEEFRLPETFGVHTYPSALFYSREGTLLRKGVIANERGLMEVMNGASGDEPPQSHRS